MKRYKIYYNTGITAEITLTDERLEYFKNKRNVSKIDEMIFDDDTIKYINIYSK